MKERKKIWIGKNYIMAYCVNEREEEIVPTVDELIENGYIVKKRVLKMDMEENTYLEKATRNGL